MVLVERNRTTQRKERQFTGLALTGQVAVPEHAPRQGGDGRPFGTPSRSSEFPPSSSGRAAGRTHQVLTRPPRQSKGPGAAPVHPGRWVVVTTRTLADVSGPSGLARGVQPAPDFLSIDRHSAHPWWQNPAGSRTIREPRSQATSPSGPPTMRNRANVSSGASGRCARRSGESHHHVRGRCRPGGGRAHRRGHRVAAHGDRRRG